MTALYPECFDDVALLPGLSDKDSARESRDMLLTSWAPKPVPIQAQASLFHQKQILDSHSRLPRDKRLEKHFLSNSLTTCWRKGIRTQVVDS